MIDGREPRPLGWLFNQGKTTERRSIGMQDIESTIRQAQDDHLLTTSSKTRRAGCTCNAWVRFEWAHRDEEHRMHLMTAIFKAGRDSAGGDLRNDQGAFGS